MEYPTVINWTSPFPFFWVLGGTFNIFLQISVEEAVSKQWGTWSDATERIKRR